MGTKGVSNGPHDASTRAAISESLRLHNALRTPEQKAAHSQKISDAHVCNMWIPHGPRPGNIGGAGRPRSNNVDGHTPVGNTTLAKLEKASIKKIIKDLATTEPELFREAIIAGLLAPPPRSFPYLALAAAYLDGKPVDGDPPIQQIVDLSALSRDELRDRAERLVRLLKSPTDHDVIDVTVIPNPEEMTAEQLAEEIRLAQIEVDKANEELRRLKK
jgi:hypothetical protein